MNFGVASFASDAASSGKYRVSGFCDFDCSSTFLPSRKATQRKPSHFGSYCHSGPCGNSSRGARFHRLVAGANRQRHSSLLRLVAPVLASQGSPEVAKLTKARRNSLHREVLQANAALHFFPGDRRGNRGPGLRPDGIDGGKRAAPRHSGCSPPARGPSGALPRDTRR